MKKIILASQSPRRKELLKQIGMDFDVCVPECDENIQSATPADLVCRLSELKAKSVLDALSIADNKIEAIIVGADTVVVLDGDIIGKPKDSADAKVILRKLSGKTHAVITGVTIINTFSEKSVTFFEKTSVTFYELTDKEIEKYVNTKEPLDKAGAYGIQGPGAVLVEKIDGDYYNVVGLPLGKLYRFLQDC